MNNSLNKNELSSTAIKLHNYIRQDREHMESATKFDCSVIEPHKFVSYVSAIRNNNTESVTFVINVGANQRSAEIRKLNTIIEGKPIMTFVSSGS